MRHCPNCGREILLAAYCGLCASCAAEKLRLEKIGLEFYTREDRPRPSITQMINNIDQYVARNLARFKP